MKGDELSAKRVVIVGGGFAGLNAAKRLGNVKGLRITLIDKRNHHLFQPLLYQVATAALNPADIATPIRSILSSYKNVDVLMGNAISVNLKKKYITADFGDLAYDYLLLACGATHSYFGHKEWESFAPGLKSLEEAIEIRRRILTAYEQAEIEKDPEKQKQLLTFVVIGGGPTGVELAGAIGEISRLTMIRDFRNINPGATRVILIEAGPRILPQFDQSLSVRAFRDLERLGVSVWTNSIVTDISANGVIIGKKRIRAGTVLWAAGIGSLDLNRFLDAKFDRMGRVIVQQDLSLEKYPEVFVAGDQACFIPEGSNVALPGLAPVALQEGRFIAKNIIRELQGLPRKNFKYFDKGIMATIGRASAVVQTRQFKLSGYFAWITWLFIHIMYLAGFRNRFIVMIQWIWSYITKHRGSRLITVQNCKELKAPKKIRKITQKPFK